MHPNFACMHVAVHARSTAAPCLLLLANAGLLSRNSCPTHLWSQNPAQILVPTNSRCTTSEGPWLNPDLVGKWSYSPAKALPFLPQAQTNTILILNPSSNPLYSCSSISPTYSPVRNVAKQMPSLLCLLFYDAFSGHAFLFLCVSMHLQETFLHKKKYQRNVEWERRTGCPPHTPTYLVAPHPHVRLSMGLKSETEV